MLFLSLSSNQGCDSLGSPCSKKTSPVKRQGTNKMMFNKTYQLNSSTTSLSSQCIRTVSKPQVSVDASCGLEYHILFSAHGLQRTSSKAWAGQQQKATFDGGKTLGIRRFGVQNSHQLLLIIHRDSEGWELKVMTCRPGP